ncbi:hypothetical protein RIF29_41591 [Crotalaria pallida]|uniref:Uncharacterized protein n=1 Tax=Crotalaria pallida TaxID=3830 RepID=A0AAN9HRS8_CROPI
MKGMFGIEGMLGKGGRLTLGIVGIVGMLGSGGKVGLGRVGCVIDGIVGKGGTLAPPRGNVGIEGKGGNVVGMLGKFGGEVVVCKRWRAPWLKLMLEKAIARRNNVMEDLLEAMAKLMDWKNEELENME